MKFRVIREGVISRRVPGTATSATLAPRCAVTRAGTLVCMFTVQPELGTNDFKPLLARSTDGGQSWSEAEPVWSDEFHERHSVYANLTAVLGGDLVLLGTRTDVGARGEPYWSWETWGFRQNELVLARSVDNGVTWGEMEVIPMLMPGSAEQGPFCETRAGVWLLAYSPYRTFDPGVVVETNQVVCLRSADRGRSWQQNAMLRFPDLKAHGTEGWIVELTDGRVVGITWNIREGMDLPNPYAISEDHGMTWGPTLSTGIVGQSAAMAALDDGRIAFVYNQRKFGQVGIWLAIARPTTAGFGIIHNECVWAATLGGSESTGAGANDLEGWLQFAFGGPAPTLLADGTILISFWCKGTAGCEIRYVRVALP